MTPSGHRGLFGPHVSILFYKDHFLCDDGMKNGHLELESSFSPPAERQDENLFLLVQTSEFNKLNWASNIEDSLWNETEAEAPVMPSIPKCHHTRHFGWEGDFSLCLSGHSCLFYLFLLPRTSKKKPA